MEPQAYVTSAEDKGVATLTFFHPQHNAMPSDLLAKLRQAIVQAGQDPAVKVIVLCSAGERSFCAGASFEELVAIENKAQGEAFFNGFAQVINAMRLCPKFIIARIHGKAVGGGVGLAASADYALASQYASVKLSELSIGIGPFVVAPAIARKIGVSALGQMTLNAKTFYTAQWAKDKGLFAEVLPDAQALDDAIETLCHELKSYHPEAMAEMKRALWSGTEHWETLLAERAAISGGLVLNDFTKATLERFK
ncbi:MAG: enoyl-CoA hydratase [Cryomorphaceae bacterium BACL21 MAG-121220-bin10]|nr:MAG: enoyl-CoA hydratase [Cryomorphaceae bacterium BACL21 MAG-121220-bin10]MDB9781991.1 enoyl-CoA hydratase/isomerase family protein [Winogradskyella sp.]